MSSQQQLQVERLRTRILGRLDKFRIFKALGYEPHRLQREVHLSTAPRRVLACGVRWGKTKSSAFEGIYAGLEPTPPGTIRRGWVVAPSYELCDKVLREIFIEVRTKLRELVVKTSDSERMLLMHNMGGGLCEIRGKSADSPDSLLGEGLDWVIVDEAARLRPFIWERYLTARLIDKRGWALLISTPKGKGWYYDLWRRGQGGADPQYLSWNAPTWTNPHIDRREIQAAQLRVPEAVFRQEFGAEFIEGAGQVFRLVRDAAVLTRYPNLQEEYEAAQKVGVRDERELWGGLDLAKDVDYTVFTIVDDLGRVVYFDRFHRVDWALQISRVRVASEAFGFPTTYVDSTGLGEPIYERLLQAGLSVAPYSLSQSSKQELVNALAISLEQRELRLPSVLLNPTMIDELESFHYEITDLGHRKMGAPAGCHDDCVISLGLANWGRTLGRHYSEQGDLLGA